MMNSRSWSIWPYMAHSQGLFAAIALALSLAGCGSDLAQVSGVVTLDGEPVRGGNGVRGTVCFQPASGEGRAAVGIVDENGAYRLSSGSEEAGPAPLDYWNIARTGATEADAELTGGYGDIALVKGTGPDAELDNTYWDIPADYSSDEEEGEEEAEAEGDGADSAAADSAADGAGAA